MNTTALPHEFSAIFSEPDQFDELKKYPDHTIAGISFVWGRKKDEEGYSLTEILADSGFWSLDDFEKFLSDGGYDPQEILDAREVIEKAKPEEVRVGRWIQYAVPKPPGPTEFGTGKILRVERNGSLRAGEESSVEGTEEDPAVEFLVYARRGDDRFIETDRKVVRPASKLRMIDEPENIDKQIELNAQVRSALERKVEEHNEKVGEAKSKRATYRMLAAAMRRGIGAYKTNPGSVRPSVSSPEQWGYGRVNGLLHALRTGKFKRTAFDTDLLPEGHPLSTKKEKQADDLFESKAEALSRAEEIGCVGFHVHEVDGSIRYMPCDQMSDYEKLTGLAHRSPENLELVDSEKAVWSTAYINRLPDDAFFYIAPGGEKDEENKTVPRSLRKLPFKDVNGDVDLPHLRNALARLSQTDIPSDEMPEIRDRARRILEESTVEKALAKRYEDIDFEPPQSVADAAELGLSLRRQHGRGGTMIGVARARDLRNRKRMRPETIKRMVSFFARHEIDLEAPKNKDRSHPDYPGAGRIAWLLWGGDPGRTWALRILDRMRREDVKKEHVLLSNRIVDIPNVPVETSNASVSVVAKSVDRFEEVAIQHVIDGTRVLIIRDAGSITIKSDRPVSDNLYLSKFDDLPDGSIIEAVIRDDGMTQATDILSTRNVDLTDLPFSLRKHVLDTIVADLNCDGIQTVDGHSVSGAEEMVLSVRDISEQHKDGAIEIRRSSNGYGSEVVQLEISKSRKDLWKYVAPKKVSNPKALFITGSPNRLEAIRNLPLAGHDGATFKSSYLERLDIDISEVSVAHSKPTTSLGENLDWDSWLERFVGSHPNVPVVALGKIASKALGDIPHVTMPHPRVIRQKGDRGEVARKAKAVRKSLEKARSVNSKSRFCPIFKADEEKRIVYGVVLEPDSRDLQGDVLTVDTIEAAAHKYLVASRTVGDSHSLQADAEVVESYLAPADYELGGQVITKGTWIMGVRVLDEAMWLLVKAGEYTGFSIGGTGERKEIEEDISSR